MEEKHVMDPLPMSSTAVRAYEETSRRVRDKVAKAVRDTKAKVKAAAKKVEDKMNQVIVPPKDVYLEYPWAA